MDADVAVSNRAWLELLHAEVCWTLSEAGVDALIIKGPSIGEWLYDEGEREPSDVDVLLRPAQWDAAAEALTKRGFSRKHHGLRDSEVALHSLELHRTDPRQGAHELDLHRFFPGIDATPEAAFDVLWNPREAGHQAGVPVWYPAKTARALLIFLHAARDADAEKTAEDLRRVVNALETDGLIEVADLAARLDALPALRAGLETQAETPSLVEAMGLGDVEVPAYWALRSQGADPMTAELARVSALPLRDRAAAVARWVFPTGANLRERDPRAADSSLVLAGLYVKRWGSGLRRLPRAIRDIRRTRG